MHYRFKGVEIHSENAAKPATDAAAYLVDWLRRRRRTYSALDYGCGKLRYTRHLACRSEHIGVVDSEVQLRRTQRIFGQQTSIAKYVKCRWPFHTLQHLEDFWTKSLRFYDFVLCANVLSAIPCPKARARSLRAIYAAVRRDGRVLFVNQHTNSYFTEVRKRPSTWPHLDGWVTTSSAGSFYYGVLNRYDTAALVSRFGFFAEETWINGQANYVLARKI